MRHHQSTTQGPTRQADAVDLAAPLIDQPAARPGPGGKLVLPRPQPWAEHRSEAELLAWAYDRVDSRKASRLRGCAPRLIFARRADAGPDSSAGRAAEAAPGALRLHSAWFCRVRLCPVCQWRRSLKIYGQTAQVMRAIEAREPGRYAWLMLTVTVRNCDPYELGRVLGEISQAWHRLARLEAFRCRVIGWQRNTEVTHNLDLASGSYDTYHPHIHALLQVRQSYFKHKYLPAAAWGALWQQAARLDYAPSVEVHRVRGSTAAALAEVTKYSTKPGAYIVPDDLDMMLESVEVLDAALAGRRLMGMGGMMRDVHHELGLDDAEAGDLVHTDQPDEAAAPELVQTVSYSWAPGSRGYFRDLHQLGQLPASDAAANRAAAGRAARSAARLRKILQEVSHE